MITTPLKRLRKNLIGLFCRIVLRNPELKDPIAIRTILAEHGLEDGIRALPYSTLTEKQQVAFAVRCVKLVRGKITSQHAQDAIDAAEAYSKGLISRGELDRFHTEYRPVVNVHAAALCLTYREELTEAVFIILVGFPEKRYEIIKLLEEIL